MGLANVIMRLTILYITLFTICSCYYTKWITIFKKKNNHLTCNQLAVLTVLTSNQPFRRAGKVSMSQFPTDVIFVEIKMMPHSVQMMTSQPPDILKVCFKREKPILFNEQSYLFSVLSVSKVLVSVSKKPLSITLIKCLH